MARADFDARDIDAQLPARRANRSGEVVALAEAIARIPDGARVYISPICGVPTALVDELARQHDRWQVIELVSDYLVGALAPFDHAGAPFRMTSLQPTPAVDAMAAAGVLRVVPASYAQFAKVLAPGGPLSIDVALVQVSPPGPEGRFSLGVAAGAGAEVARTADMVIAEVNPAMPYTFGVTELERGEIDLLVEVEHPLVELPRPAGTPVTDAIGAAAAEEVPEHATLQFGIGAIPESVLARLADRDDLGMHGGMVGDLVVELAERGALTGRRKSVDAGLHVVGGAIGTRAVFDWVHRNEALAMVSSRYSHGVPALARQDRFTAINSAIEVALDGSVNAELAGGRVVSGPGGQPDFAAGAALAAGGRAIIALPSTAGRDGKLSRIVREIPPQHPTTVPRYLADRVVTEHGVAVLAAQPLDERAERLRAIADPAHRSQLGG